MCVSRLRSALCAEVGMSCGEVGVCAGESVEKSMKTR